MVAAAIVGAAVVGGGASLAASGSASRTARDVATQNNQLATDQYNRSTAALQPYQEGGNRATSAIQALLGLSGTGEEAIANQNSAFNNWRNSTGYQDQYNEGARAVTSALGNRGLLDSGAAQKALVRYGQQQSNQSFGSYYNALAGQQGVGLSAANAQAGIGGNYVNAVTNSNNQAANTSANAALSGAGTINSVLGSALSAYGYSRGFGSSYGGGGNEWYSGVRGGTLLGR